jgi:hypothetical protein
MAPRIDSWPKAAMLRLVRCLFALGICGVVVAASSASPQAAGAAPGSLHIHDLRGAVARVGTYTIGGDRYPLLGVRLRATVCVRSSSEALKFYPSEIGVTHFAVSRSRQRWWPARTVVDRAPWLVPLGETWNGQPCGKVFVDDPIPPQHIGAESLGNPNNCYGVALTIRAGNRQASKRAIIRCPFGTP